MVTIAISLPKARRPGRCENGVLRHAARTNPTNALAIATPVARPLAALTPIARMANRPGKWRAPSSNPTGRGVALHALLIPPAAGRHENSGGEHANPQDRHRRRTDRRAARRLRRPSAGPGPEPREAQADEGRDHRPEHPSGTADPARTPMPSARISSESSCRRASRSSSSRSSPTRATWRWRRAPTCSSSARARPLSGR